MGKLNFEKGCFSNCTSVSNMFLDNYMPKANGDYVKIYLFLLRYSADLNFDLSICKIADTFDLTERDIIRGLRYWENEGLLSLTFSDIKLSGIRLNDYPDISGKTHTKESTTVKYKEPEPPEQASSDATQAVPPKKTYTAKELDKLTSKEDLCQLLYIIQRYLGKSLSPSETNTVLYFYDTLGFSADLIEYLVEYCVSKEHKSMRYIEKVALAWATEGISTVKEAKAASRLYNISFNKVLKAFGISGRTPGESEKAFILKWTDSYGFDLDIIIEACNRTIDNTHQPSFEYADSILSNWNSKGIRKLSDINVLDEEWGKEKAKKARKTKEVSKTNNFNSGFAQRTYDYAELEKQLLK